MDRQTNRQTDDSDFIRRCLSNVERSIHIMNDLKSSYTFSYNFAYKKQTLCKNVRLKVTKKLSQPRAN